jgi:GT2 family glycosyltransferase
MDVSICIVRFNYKDLLADCIESIHANTHDLSYEIIVVDNDSKDGTVALLYEKYPEVRVIANADNKGFGTANNQVIAVATVTAYC